MFLGKDKSKKGSKNATDGSSEDPQKQHGGAGIMNLGNTCYLASVVQGLAASRPLRDALVEYPGAEKALQAAKTSNSADVDVNANSDVDQYHHNAYSTMPTVGTPTAETSPSLQLLTENPFPDSLPLSSALASTLVKLWSGKQSVISVKTLMKALNRKNEDWNEFDQMDAHELLRYLLDGVSMEEMDLIKRLNPPSPTKVPKRSRKVKAAMPIAEQLRLKAEAASARRANHEESGHDEGSMNGSESESDLSTSEADSLVAEDPTYRKKSKRAPPPRYTPFIDTIFGGKLASVIVCEECRGVSRIEEDFLDLSLSIKGDDGKVRRRDRLRKFLSSSNGKAKDTERPKMASRAPSNILSVSETEASDTDILSESLSRQSSSLTANSAVSGLSSTADSSRVATIAEDEDESAAKVRRRKSLDPSILRRTSVKRNFLSPKFGSNGNTGLTEPTNMTGSLTLNTSNLKRGSSIRSSGSSNASSAPISPDGQSPRPLTSSSAVSQRSGSLPRTPGSGSERMLKRPTREEQDYIRKLFAEIPGPSPLAALRVAQPTGMPSFGQHLDSKPSQDVPGTTRDVYDAMNTGLYSCLMQFTSVETLDGENSFQCRRCWKLLNAGQVTQFGRRRIAKMSKKQGGASAITSSQQGDTSIGQGSAAGESMVMTNRKLMLEKVRQLSEESSTPPRQGPQITITATSPPISRHASDALEVIATEATASAHRQDAEARQSDPAASGFSEMTIMPLHTGGQTALDTGDETDSEPIPSDYDTDTMSSLPPRPTRTAPSVPSVRSSANTSMVSFADQVTPNTTLAGSDISHASKSLQSQSIPPMPDLPKRSLRFVARKAHKRYLISSLPPILVLHLKRFQQTSKSSLFGSFSNLKKLDDKVTFPLHLDMSAFIAPPPFHQSSRAALANSSSQDTDRGRSLTSDDDKKHWFRRRSPSAETRSKSQYRLYGVISHQGNMTAGHYIAYTLTSQRNVDGQKLPPPNSVSKGSDSISRSDYTAARQWVHYSDDDVRPVSLEEVLKSQAYCLLYERVDVGNASKL